MRKVFLRVSFLILANLTTSAASFATDYWIESCIVKARDINKIIAAGMRYLRRFKGCIRLDCMKNEHKLKI
jgi:hypothetical protein